MRFLVMLGAVFGVLFLILAFLAPGAPGQAAWAATACAVCIIPYVGFRASQLTDEENERRKYRAEMLALLKAQQPKE